MRNIQVLFFLIIVLLSLLSCESATDSSQIISIQEQGDLLSVDPRLDQHQNRDVEVFKVDDVQQLGERTYVVRGYRFVYYHDVDDSLKSLQNFYPTPENFTKAEPSWLDDTTFILRFFNSQSQKEASIKVFGKDAAHMLPMAN